MPRVRQEGHRAEWGSLSVSLSAGLCDLCVRLALNKSYKPVQLEAGEFTVDVWGNFQNLWMTQHKTGSFPSRAVR